VSTREVEGDLTFLVPGAISYGLLTHRFSQYRMTDGFSAEQVDALVTEFDAGS
jgi:hypothetical protein